MAINCINSPLSTFQIHHFSLFCYFAGKEFPQRMKIEEQRLHPSAEVLIRSIMKMKTALYGAGGGATHTCPASPMAHAGCLVHFHFYFFMLVITASML